MTTSNLGKIKVLVDWDNTGCPAFEQLESDPLNLISNAAFPASMLGFNITGILTVQSDIPPSYPISTLDHPRYSKLNPYGVETFEIISSSTGGTLEIGTEFIIPVNPSTDYTLWVWINDPGAWTNDGTHNLFIGTNEYKSDMTTITHVVNTSFETVGSSATPKVVFHHFTTNSDAAFITYTLGIVSGDSRPLVINILGAFLMLGSNEIEPTWNNAATHGFLNDITSYTKSASGHIGKTRWDTKLFDEGNLTLNLDNQTKNFSPENRDSPYYGLMNPYIKVWVLFSNQDDKYTMLWSGFIQQFGLSTGIFNNREATITCRQGKYIIEAQDTDFMVASADVFSDEAIQSLFGGGYIIPSATNNSDFSPQYILEFASDSGVNIPIYGVEFVGDSGNKSYLTALENISELNGNYLFLSRYGRIIFGTYDSIKDSDPDELAYNLTTETHYTYAPDDLYKEIIVNYDVYSSASSGIEMQGQEEVVPAGSSSFPFRIDPKYNNKPLIGDVVLDVTSFLPTDYTAIIASGSANATPVTHTEGLYTWFSVLANNSLQDGSSNGLDARISFVSRGNGQVYYASEINQTLNVVGIDGKGQPTLTYNNPLITTDDMATDFANMQANRRASIASWFDSATIPNKNAAAMLFLANHSLGSVVYIQEEQSGNIPKHLIIIGEDFNWTPTFFQMHYTLAPTGGEVDIAAFTYDADELDVDFTDLSVVAPEATYLWDFGD